MATKGRSTIWLRIMSITALLFAWTLVSYAASNQCGDLESKSSDSARNTAKCILELRCPTCKPETNGTLNFTPKYVRQRRNYLAERVCFKPKSEISFDGLRLKSDFCFSTSKFHDQLIKDVTIGEPTIYGGQNLFALTLYYSKSGKLLPLQMDENFKSLRKQVGFNIARLKVSPDENFNSIDTVSLAADATICGIKFPKGTIMGDSGMYEEVLTVNAPHSMKVNGIDIPQHYLFQIMIGGKCNIYVVDPKERGD